MIQLIQDHPYILYLPHIGILLMGVFCGYLYIKGYANMDYMLHRSAFKLYKKYKKNILKNRQTYNRFVLYFENHHKYQERKEGQDIADFNATIAYISEFIDCLQSNQKTFELYFNKDKFRYIYEYKELCQELNQQVLTMDSVLEESIEDATNERLIEDTDNEKSQLCCDNTTLPSTQSNQFIQKSKTLMDILIIEDKYKEKLLENIWKCISDPSNRGKANGTVIRVLLDLGYIEKDLDLSVIIDFINTYFQIKLQDDRGIYNYVLGGKITKPDYYNAVSQKIKINKDQFDSIK